MKTLLFLSVLLLTFNGLYAEREKEQVAVLDLEADGLSVSESATLTNRLRSELVKIGKYTIVERAKMNEILQEQGFQMTGCTSSECAVEAGRILSVNRICTGNVGKVGEIYTLTIRLINVESGAILKSVTEDCQCPIEQVLTRSIPLVAAKLSGKKVQDNGAYGILKGKGDIYINSIPQGAEIYIDNIKIGNITPTVIKNIIAGNHEIKLIKGKYTALKQVTVVADELLQENITLDKNKSGGLKVYSKISGANIYINGKLYGTTPKIIKNLLVGTYLVTLKRAPDFIYEQKVNIEYNKFFTVDCELKKQAILHLSSKPAGAEIFINNIFIGNTNMPYKIYPRDNIKIRMVLKNYVTWEKTISLKESEQKKIETVLEREKGIIKFTKYSKGSILTFKEKNYTMQKDKLTLPVGMYTFEISCAGYLSKEWKVEIKAGRSEIINASLERKTKGAAVIRSFFIPGWGQGYQGKSGRSWLYGISYLAALGGSVYYTLQYNDAVVEYDDLQEQYNNAADPADIAELREKMFAKYDDVNSFESTRNGFYIAAGVIWLWNMVDVLFLPPSWERNMNLSAKPMKNGMMLGMSYQF